MTSDIVEKHVLQLGPTTKLNRHLFYNRIMLVSRKRPKNRYVTVLAPQTRRKSQHCRAYNFSAIQSIDSFNFENVRKIRFNARYKWCLLHILISFSFKNYILNQMFSIVSRHANRRTVYGVEKGEKSSGSDFCWWWKSSSNFWASITNYVLPAKTR